MEPERTRLLWFWAAQSISLSRVCLAFFFVVLSPFASLSVVTAIVYALAWASDYIDGRVARSGRAVSGFGRAFDIFGDRYLLVVSCIYAGFRGVNFAILGIILVRELFSVAMRMVQIRGQSVMVSNPKIGGIVHAIVAIGVLRLILAPTETFDIGYELPFVAVAVFYLAYFPYTIRKSWPRIKESIYSDLLGP